MPSNPKDLAEVELFKLLDEDELSEFAAVIDTERVKAGDTVFNAGDYGESLYVVKSGEVELFIKDNAGQKIVLKVAEKDDLFGEISMLDNRPRSATAVCLMNADLFVLDRHDLLLLFQKHPDSGLNMLAAICGM